jgi:hypothetical protein
MRRLWWMAGLIALTGCAAQAQTPDERFIPDPWLGEWNENLEDCGTGNNDSRLRIEANRVLFYEGGGMVRGAFLHGPFEIVVVLDMTGEGQTWIAAHHFIMSASGHYISTDGDDPLVRYRCPRASR